MNLVCNLTPSFKTIPISRPAVASSFVVVNFTNNKDSCYKFVKTVMKVARSHGIDIPSTTMDVSQHGIDVPSTTMDISRDRYLDLVTVHYNGGDEVGNVSKMQLLLAIFLLLLELFLHDCLLMCVFTLIVDSPIKTGIGNGSRGYSKSATVSSL